MTLHVKGAKDDKGKLRMGLVISGFIPAILEVCKIGTFGANKYTANGWQEVEQGYDRYEDAMWRHWSAFKMGEANDPESGFPHLAHFAWNALAILTFYLKGKIDGSTNYCGQHESSGSANHDIRAGVSSIHPRRADDTSDVQQERPVKPSRPSQERLTEAIRKACDLGQKSSRDEFRGAPRPLQEPPVPFSVEVVHGTYPYYRKSSWEDWVAQAMGKPDNGAVQ